MRGHPGSTQSLSHGLGVRACSVLSHPASDPVRLPGLPCSPSGLSTWLLLLFCQIKTQIQKWTEDTHVGESVLQWGRPWPRKSRSISIKRESVRIPEVGSMGGVRGALRGALDKQVGMSGGPPASVLLWSASFQEKLVWGHVLPFLCSLSLGAS